MFVACGIWCLAGVSSVSPSAEPTAIIPTGNCAMTTKTGSQVANKIERKRCVICVIVQLIFQPWVKVL